METIKQTIGLTEAFDLAKKLPTHVNGELQDHCFYLDEKPKGKLCVTLYNDNVTPAYVFHCMEKIGLADRIGKRNASGYYVRLRETHREDGSLKKKSEWDEVLYYHKLYARKDEEVKSVSFKIVGLKRKTTHLSAGVLITDIKFEF